jgi:hypothetical protein
MRFTIRDILWLTVVAGLTISLGILIQQKHGLDQERERLLNWQSVLNLREMRYIAKEIALRRELSRVGGREVIGGSYSKSPQGDKLIYEIEYESPSNK